MDERDRVKIFKFKEQSPVLWPNNKIGATDRFWWLYDASKESKWFNCFCICCLQPGQSESMHSHMEEYEGPYETWYLIYDGIAELRTEYGNWILERFDAIFVPTGASHQIRNAGTEPLWWGSLSSRGGQPLKVDTYNIPCSEERPGYMEEFQRIVEARRKRGLQE